MTIVRARVIFAPGERWSLEDRILRIVGYVATIAFVVAISAGASAQQPDFSGKWLFSGLILGAGAATSFAQICDLQQTGGQLAGPCHGPNGGCSAVGVVSGGAVDLMCRTSYTNNPGLAGVLTFHGALAADNVVRGAVTHSRAPGVIGQASLMRV